MAPSSDRPSVTASALLTAFVVSYGRCFTKSEWTPGREAVLLPDSAVSALGDVERSLHHRLVSLRMQEFAHSDVTAADISVTAHQSAFLVPTSRVMRHYGLDSSDLAIAVQIVEKLVVYVTLELTRLQDELAPFGSWQQPSPPAAA